MTPTEIRYRKLYHCCRPSLLFVQCGGVPRGGMTWLLAQEGLYAVRELRRMRK
jgi:hypothetical protein